MALFTRVYLSVHPCKGASLSIWDAQVFHESACRQSYSCLMGYSGCIDTASGPNLMAMQVWVCVPTLSAFMDRNSMAVCMDVHIDTRM